MRVSIHIAAIFTSIARRLKTFDRVAACVDTGGRAEMTVDRRWGRGNRSVPRDTTGIVNCDDSGLRAAVDLE